MIRSPQSRSSSEALGPFPLVPIDSRRHVVADPTRTRFGVGEVRIDHAAGVPLRARRLAATPASDWEEQPRFHDGAQLRARAFHPDDDAPVELPLRSRSSSIIVMAGLFLAFVAVCASIFFSGISATTLVKRETPVTEPARAVAPPSTQTVSDTASTTAAIPAPGEKLVTPGTRRSEFVQKH